MELSGIEVTLSIKDDQYTNVIRLSRKSRIKIDATKALPHIDIFRASVPSGEELVSLGVFKLEGQRLIIWTSSQGPRPEGVSDASDSEDSFIEFKRENP